ncbi:MAG: chromate transporter [Ruminococcaceae bacterium]|nr:chromate transporter [Oscillospiraceae bacterium]
MKSKIRIWLGLFLSFLRIGAFTFGGGYAMIPLIQKEAVEKNKWVTDDDILEIVAIAESTPGPIAINAATFIGYRVGGILGAFFSTFGVVLPSFVIILLISHLLREFQEYRAFRYAFEGIRAGVLALIIKALFGMYKKCKKGLFAYIAMAASFILAAFFDVPVYFIIIGCALFGLVTSLLHKRRAEK